MGGLLGLALTATAGAQTKLEISWGSSVLRQKMILEDGAALTTEPLFAEVGSFGSFVPTASNMAQWMANWKAFDGITSPDSDPNGSDFFSADPGNALQTRFAGSAHLLIDQTSDSEDAASSNPGAMFGPVEQGYVFFRTSNTLATGSQWLLFTSAADSDGSGLADSVWQFPAVNTGQPQISLAWWLDQADTAVVGAINGGGGGGGVTGSGSHTDGSNDFVVRLHYVPEPGAALFLVAGVVLLLRRRRLLS